MEAQLHKGYFSWEVEAKSLYILLLSADPMMQLSPSFTEQQSVLLDVPNK